MSESNHENTEHLSRRQAAERLTDVAYALTTGGPLSLGPGRQDRVPIADEVVLKRESRSCGGQVQVDLELSWSTTEANDR